MPILIFWSCFVFKRVCLLCLKDFQVVRFSRLHYVILFIFPNKTHLIHTLILEKGSCCPKNQGEQQMQTNDKIQTLQLDSCHDIFGEDPGVVRDDHKWSIYAMYTHRKTYICGTSMYIYIHIHITCVYIYTYIQYIPCWKTTNISIHAGCGYIYICIYMYIYICTVM